MEGQAIRKAFVPAAGWTLLAADYSQIELRILAALSQDAGLLNAFKNNEDIHASTAAKIFDVAINDVSREQRSTAKMVNFGIPYGISAYGLSAFRNHWTPRGSGYYRSLLCSIPWYSRLHARRHLTSARKRLCGNPIGSKTLP